MGKDLHSVSSEPGLGSPPPAKFTGGDFNSAWEEPALAGVTEPPEESLYATFYKTKLAARTTRSTLAAFLFCVLAAGPFAVVTVFAYQPRFEAGIGILGAVLFAPLTEEFAKIAAPLIILERFPWRWSRGSQLVLACMFSGMVFAAIENLLYLFVYIENPSSRLIIWRWTVCVLVHTLCSTIAGFGLLRVWRDTRKEFTRPNASLAVRFVAAAMILHGIYNAIAIFIRR